MSISTSGTRPPHIPMGGVEPHADILQAPPPGQLLYKVMTIENFLRSVKESYLYFNLVNSYNDFPGADPHDGKQPPNDEPSNSQTKFLKAPSFSAADYYDQSRARTYACCFALEDSVHLWAHYGQGSALGQVELVFDFDKLRAELNRTLASEQAMLMYKGIPCHQIFYLNYGIIEYIDWSSHRENSDTLPNPIRYTYIKDKKFSDEKELRVSLSAIGMGKFALADGSLLEFGPSMHLFFDFRAAIASGIVKDMVLPSAAAAENLTAGLKVLGITAVEGHQ